MPRARVTSRSCPAGRMPRPCPLGITGSRKASAKSRATSSARSIQTSDPSTSTGRSAWAISRAMPASVSGSGSRGDGVSVSASCAGEGENRWSM